MIRVGIKTAGKPEIENRDGFTIVKNMLIGDGFHWQQTIEAKLPGKIYLLENEEAHRSNDGDEKIKLINELPLETYLECVVGSEMNPEAPIEFLKAHALISRSWALGKILNRHSTDNEGRSAGESLLIGWDDTAGHSICDVCSDDHCQRYQGWQPISEKALRAIRETTGEVLFSPDGQLVDARFSKCCGGKTEIFSTCWQPRDEACLESFDDPWCDLSKLTKTDREHLLRTILKDYDLETQGYGYRWETSIDKTEIAKNLSERFGRDIGEIERLEPLHKGPSGRIDLLRIHGSDGVLDIGKELWIRRLLAPTHLYSSAFEIEDKGKIILLKGQGWGHGVGLCQIGAANMAMHGHSYRNILAFYYPNSRIRKPELWEGNRL